MRKFQYTALDARGNEITGVVEAEDSAAASVRIKEMGCFPTSVEEVGATKRVSAQPADRRRAAGLRKFNLNISLGGGVKGKVLTAFTRQMATLIDAGMPLLRGLRLMEEQEKHPALKRAIRGIAGAVESGSTLSESMELYPRIFSRLYVNMVRAGEVAGALETVLNRLAQFQEKAQKIKGKVIAAMVYPAVVLAISGAIVTFLMIFVVPRFQEMFTEMMDGKPLPPLTLFLLAISRAIQHHALATLAGLAAFVIGIKMVAKSRKGSYVLDAIKLRMPLFGQLVRKVSISRFTRTLGTLMSSGVPILQALLITRDTAGNQILAAAVQRVHDAVKEGESIVQPLKGSRVFPPVVVGMIGIGEETGALPEMLMKIAENYDDEVDNAVSALTSLIEPIMIVGLALVVGTIVIALFLPLFVLIGGGGIG